MKRGKKILLIIAAVIVILLLLTVVFISPIAKYLIEKHSVEYTGRQVKMDGLRINIFNGSVRASGLKIYEPKSQSVFVSCSELKMNITVNKLWSSKYDITELAVVQPVIHILQQGDHFNYDDLMTRFFSDTTPPDPKAKPTQYWVHNLRVDSAKIIYENKKPYAKVELIKTNVSVPLIAWDDPKYKINAFFDLATGGHFKGEMLFNVDTYQYNVSLDMDKLSINWMYPYLRDYMKVKSLDGLISGRMKITGNVNKPTDVAASGNLVAEKFSIVDETDELLSAVDQLSIKIDTVNTARNLYNFSTISLSRPFIRLSMYEKGFNYERIMTTPYDASGDSVSVVYSNIFLMMASYIQDIVKQYDVNNYKINKLSITGGRCVFTDFTHGDRFRYVLDSLDMSSDKLNSNNPELVFNVKSRLNTSGKMKGTLKVDPKNYKDIEIDAQVKDLLMTDFNPYTKYYVATPFLDGKISYVNHTIIKGGKLDSKNVLDITKLTAGKKIKDVSTAINLPVRLAVSLLKDVHGNVHIDIPVKGSLDDPKFKWGKVVWDVVKNLMEKVVTAPFRWLAGLFGGKEEDFKEIQLEYIQAGMEPAQQQTLDRLAKVATEKPDLKIELIQVTNKEDEASFIALLEMKRQYLSIPPAEPFTAAMKKRTDSISNNDTLFVKYLNTKLKSNSNLQSTEEKCVQVIGKTALDARVIQMMEARNKAFTNYLVIQKNIPANRISVLNAKEEDQLQRSAPPKYVVNVAVMD